METKKRILRSLRPKDRNLKCPKCHSDKFIKRTEIVIGIVDELEHLRDEELGEETHTYICERCKIDIANEELVK